MGSFLPAVHFPVPLWGEQAVPPQDGGAPACVTAGHTPNGDHQSPDDRGEGIDSSDVKSRVRRRQSPLSLSTDWVPDATRSFLLKEAEREKRRIALKRDEHPEQPDPTAHASVLERRLGWGESFIEPFNEHSLSVLTTSLGAWLWNTHRPTRVRENM